MSGNPHSNETIACTVALVSASLLAPLAGWAAALLDD
jgi:hypothetical protein